MDERDITFPGYSRPISTDTSRLDLEVESNVCALGRAVYSATKLRNHVHNSIAVGEWISANANPIVDTRTRNIVKTSNEPSLWVKREPRFQKWLEDSTSEVLWVTGKPGSGKSDLAYRLEKALKGSIFGKTVLSHGFQSNYSAQQRSPNTLAFSIIDQLWHPDSLDSWPAPTIEKLLSLFYRFRKSPDQCQFSSLWSICTDLLKPIGDFILVIDGMDECRFDREDDASVLVDILEDLPRSTKGKVVIFSRPSFLLNIGTTTSCGSNEIRVTSQKTQSDLHQLCVAASQQLKWNNTQLQLQALKRVEDNADGSFLWATLAFQELSSIPNDKDIHTFMAMKFPDTCQGFYEKGLLRLANGAKERDIEACRSILLALLGRRRVMTIDEVSEAAGLFLTHTGPIISRWLYQFVSVHEGIPILTHPSVRDFLLADEYSSKTPHKLCLSPEEPNAFLAQRCLECLLEEKYGDPNRIARRLRSRFGLESLAEDPIGGFYAYAAENWVVHLTQIESPSRLLLGLAGSFLRSLQFSYWAEYVYTDFGDFQAIRLTQSHLVSWAKGLSEDDEALLSLEAYYEVPYKSLNEEYEGRVEDDKTLPWLPLMQLGFYYFDIGRINDMQTIRSYVAGGLCKLLGKKHPLALRSRTESAFACLQKGDLSKAREIWIEVAADQAEVIPEEDRSELYRTQLYRGMAEHLMNDYATAFRTFAYVSAKFFGSKGPASNMFLVAEMWYARTEAAVGELEKATKTLEEIRKTREDKYGTSDGFGTLTITLLSDIYRKFGEQTRSIQYLKEALKQRTRLWPVTHPLVIDASLRLAITYRDFDLEDESWEIIDQLEENSQLEEEDKFYEYCQAQHIKALLLFGDGATDEAISIQLRLLIDTEPEKTIRPLQWVRTDVADILRHRDNEGDQDTASALFGGVITCQNQQHRRLERDKDSGDDEPDTPNQLAVAEKALRLCRSESLAKAQELLDEEGFQWTYERSLWLQAGMPAADTTVMKPPRGLGDEALKKSSAF